MKNIKRIISVFLALVMIISAVGFEAIAESDIIDGVPAGYTGIYTVEDLYNVRNDLTGNYILMNDIDLTEATAQVESMTSMVMAGILLVVAMPIVTMPLAVFLMATKILMKE